MNAPDNPYLEDVFDPYCKQVQTFARRFGLVVTDGDTLTRTAPDLWPSSEEALRALHLANQQMAFFPRDRIRPCHARVPYRVQAEGAVHVAVVANTPDEIYAVPARLRRLYGHAVAVVMRPLQWWEAAPVTAHPKDPCSTRAYTAPTSLFLW